MVEQTPFGENIKFAVNRERRVACLLLLDTSESMGGKPIEELKGYDKHGDDCDYVLTRDENNPDLLTNLERTRGFASRAPFLGSRSIQLGGRVGRGAVSAPARGPAPPVAAGRRRAPRDAARAAPRFPASRPPRAPAATGRPPAHGARAGRGRDSPPP